MTDEMTYLQSIDSNQMLEDYPLDQRFMQRYSQTTREALRQRQDKDFMRCVARAWQIPFYQRLWSEHGVVPADIRTLDDIAKLPIYSKSDLMKSVAGAPPLGDYHGWDSSPGSMIFHTTSGTTGRPQPLFFSARSREIQSLLLARIYRMQGMRPRDVVHSVYGHGMINGGHYVREAVTHYTQALFCSAGTGVETRSAQQVALMRDFGANVIVGFADYIKKLADVAREEGLEPGKDIPVRMISGHLGRESRESLSEAWGGAELFDWYGVGDTGAIAGEGPDHDGLYLMEDAHFVEICDTETSDVLSDGERGNTVVTCLYKDDIYPIIRFNTNDVTEVLTTPSSIGLKLRRIAGFLGRSDNMVKIRGINVYPQALGPILEQHPAFDGQFICIATRDEAGRDALTVRVETRDTGASVAREIAALLRAKLGVDCSIELAAHDELAIITGIETRQKPIRLIDQRFK